VIYTYASFLSLIHCETRAGVDGEVANQQVYLPGILPEVPGRFYYYFGKPIETEGMTNAYFST
jgi:hypothetical protein